MMNRREFHKTALALGASAALGTPTRAAQGPALANAPIVFFSKHLAELSWADLGTAVKGMGYAGVDLTVRPGGHVLPERVTDDLPKAVAAIRDAGSEVHMLTTGLTRADDPAARPTVMGAQAVGVRLLKPGYYRYALKDVRAELAAAVEAFAGLVRLAREAGVTFGYHNHSGTYVGAPMWDTLQLVEPLPREAAGYYFDIRHAVVEGGDAGWRLGTQLVAPRLRMLAAKDFFWEKQPDGRWRIVDCPLGEGMVNWPAFFAEIAKSSFNGPVTVHVEYDPGGRTPVEKTERMLEAATRDRERLAGWMRDAVSGA
jgi:L-ribulose-5-phosphate 3-epimerase